MKLRSLSLTALTLLLAAGTAFAGRENNFSNIAPKKGDGAKPSAVTPPRTQVGGDNAGSALNIPSLPYSDSGNTCGFADDAFPTCAFAGNSTAADVFYKFTPNHDTCVNISLCGSGYDTILQVYDAALNLIDCNDDFCGLQSTVENVPLVGGQTYYIVVDGYSTDCGDYVMDITECPPPCSSQCPPGAIAEGEPSCGPEYNDVTNGGCNSSPNVFTHLDCNELGVKVCGTYGTYSFQGGDRRDTDWYEFTIDEVKNISYCVCGSQATQIAILDASQGCGNITLVCGSEFGDPGQQVCCNATLPPGTYWLFVATDGFFGIPCGSPYVLSLEGLTCPSVGAQPTSWSHIKNVYR